MKSTLNQSILLNWIWSNIADEKQDELIDVIDEHIRDLIADIHFCKKCRKENSELLDDLNLF